MATAAVAVAVSAAVNAAVSAAAAIERCYQCCRLEQREVFDRLREPKLLGVVTCNKVSTSLLYLTYMF